MMGNDPFIELPLHYGEGTAIYVRRSQVVMLESGARYSDSLDGQKLQGTDISFMLGEHCTIRFIPLSPQGVMRRFDQRE